MFMCSGMTSMHLPVRQDAMKCLDLVVRFMPGVLRAGGHAAQILPNYRVLLSPSKSTGNTTYKGGVNWNLAAYASPHLMGMSPSAKKAKTKTKLTKKSGEADEGGEAGSKGSGSCSTSGSSGSGSGSGGSGSGSGTPELRGKDLEWRLRVAASLDRSVRSVHHIESHQLKSAEI